MAGISCTAVQCHGCWTANASPYNPSLCLVPCALSRRVCSRHRQTPRLHRTAAVPKPLLSQADNPPESPIQQTGTKSPIHFPAQRRSLGLHNAATIATRLPFRSSTFARDQSFIIGTFPALCTTSQRTFFNTTVIWDRTVTLFTKPFSHQ